MPLEKKWPCSVSVVGLSLESLVVSRDDGKTLIEISIAKARDTVFGRMRAALGERKLLTAHANCDCERVRVARAPPV